MRNREDRLRDLIAAEAAERLMAGDEQTGDGDLLSWFRNSPAHIAEYLEMAKLTLDLAVVAKEIDYPLEQLVAEARQEPNIVVLPVRDLRGPTESVPRVVRPYLARTALSLAIASVIGLAISLMVLRSPMPDVALRYTTAHGEERTIRLADGTFVDLNTDSALDVKFAPHVRLVELEHGEAYFEVAKASARPFRVRVGGTEFQDVGTAFDVLRADVGSVITVAEGRVRIFSVGRSAQPNTATSYTDLLTGEQATVLPSGTIAVARAPNLDQVLAWTQEKILFNREAIREVVAEFNRYNDIPIIVRDARIASIAISGDFHVHDERAFVAFLNHLPGVRTDETMGTIVVEPRSR